MDPLGLSSKLAALLGISLLACGAQQPLVIPRAGATAEERLEDAGWARTYRLHMPAAGRARALVVVLHGGGSDGEAMEEVTGLSRIADREGFAVAYPNGLGIRGWAQFWNAGDCCGRARMLGVSDVAFIRHLVVDLSRALGLDRDRVFVVGWSNGAALTYRLGSELSDVVAGIAIYAGAMRGHGPRRAPTPELAPPARPVALIAAHATRDPRVPYQGTEDGDGLDLSFAQAGRAWAVWARCTGRASRRVERGGAIQVDAYPGCAAPVTQVTLAGWDHEWPGPERTARLPVGDRLRGFDLAEVFWSFFARQLPVR